MLYLFRKQFTLQNGNGKSWELQLAKWSPVGHSLVVVDHNDLFYIGDIENMKKPNSVLEITQTGRRGVYNGIPDWVYEGKYIYSYHSLFRLSNISKRVQ